MTLAWSMLSCLAYRILISISSVLGYRPWCRSGTDDCWRSDVYHLRYACAMLMTEEDSRCQSVCVLNIRVSVWCVDSYFKELFVLKVTFTIICLNSFVTCLTWLDISESQIYNSIFLFILFYRDVSHFLFVFPSSPGKLCIWLIKYMQPVCILWDQISYIYVPV